MLYEERCQKYGYDIITQICRLISRFIHSPYVLLRPEINGYIFTIILRFHDQKNQMTFNDKN